MEIRFVPGIVAAFLRYFHLMCPLLKKYLFVPVVLMVKADLFVQILSMVVLLLK